MAEDWNDPDGLETFVCPDCFYETSDRHAFVQHRIDEHPPRPIVLVVDGIQTQERVHGD